MAKRQLTNLERELIRIDAQEGRDGVQLNRKQREQVLAKTIERIQKSDPNLAKRLQQPFSPDRNMNLSAGQRGYLNQTIYSVRQGIVNQQTAGDLARASQFQGLLTLAATANASLNVLSRFNLANGAYNAQVAGKVNAFERQQQFWENTKRIAFLAGSTGSLLTVGAKFLAGAASPLTLAAVAATTAGQIGRIYSDNKALSGERERQDLDAQYHQMTYGRIVTRGNR